MNYCHINYIFIHCLSYLLLAKFAIGENYFWKNLMLKKFMLARIVILSHRLVGERALSKWSSPLI